MDWTDCKVKEKNLVHSVLDADHLQQSLEHYYKWKDHTGKLF